MRIPIVNEQDEIIEHKDSKDRASEDICRISGLWLTDPEGNILLAQRAFTKDREPGQWGPAAAGTVEEGETYESNIVKEAEEEIGLTGITVVPGPKMRESTSHEYFAQWFTAVVDPSYPFVKEDKEVAELRWFSRKELLKLLQEKPEMFLPNFKKYADNFIK